MSSLTAGSPTPLGASVDAGGVNFCLYSAHAERVVLCLFNAAGDEQQLTLPSHSGERWHGYLPGAGAGLRYGYRVYGPFDPSRGLRFNPAKLLIDPCARALDGQVGDDPALYDTAAQPDTVDSAPVMPKCVVVAADSYDWQDDHSPVMPWGKTVIYEAHVRGLTRQHPDIPARLRGSYAALAHPVMIDYLKTLGITTLELLPVQQHADEPRLQRLGLSNYWGYNVLAPFAVEPRYASGCNGTTALDEFRDMVKSLHRAGIEVVLDVVFNHSAELDIAGPTLSMRGIDNASYYWLDDQGDYQNWTGCGNALQLSQPGVTHWLLDCLRYWVRECHVDGFRFDLATVLGRTPDYSREAPLLAAIAADPLLAGCKLIAEPWDLGMNGYQAGNFPAPFAEWNDAFRNTMRRFWLQHDLPLGEFARRFAASDDRFSQRLPAASINMLTAHDGFTLQDLVSFSRKHNQANGEDNRDGGDENDNFAHGAEGLAVSDAIHRRRRNTQRALLTTLLLSQGTPMLLAGDEQGRSQQGNNNAYCQDNALAWLDWRAADAELVGFTAGLIRLRLRIAALCSNEWWRTSGDDSVQWLNVDGRPMRQTDWQQSEGRLQILLSLHYLFVINATTEPEKMTLPEGRWEITAPFMPYVQPADGKLLELSAGTVCVLEKQQEGVGHGEI